MLLESANVCKRQHTCPSRCAKCKPAERQAETKSELQMSASLSHSAQPDCFNFRSWNPTNADSSDIAPGQVDKFSDAPSGATQGFEQGSAGWYDAAYHTAVQMSPLVGAMASAVGAML